MKVLGLIFSLMAVTYSCFSLQADEEIIIDRLKGLILIDRQGHLVEDSENTGVTFLVDVPGDFDQLKNSLRSAYIDQPLRLDEIKKIQDTICLYYVQNGRPFVTVVAPEQELDRGVLQLQVVETVVENISVKENVWFSDDSISQHLSCAEGDWIDIEALNQDIFWINRNLFRKVDVVFTPGESPGTSNIELWTRDRRPFHVYAGYNNYGNSVTGSSQIFAGFTWGNVFGWEHILSYQFTTVPHFNLLKMKPLQVHAFDYTAPLPWRHELSIFGGYAHVDVDHHGVPMNSHGQSIQGSLRYRIPCFLEPYRLKEWIIGFDYKRTNNNVLFSNEPVFANQVALTQLMVGFERQWLRLGMASNISIEAYVSPVKWIPDQTNRDYNDLRTYAKNTYFYVTADLENITTLPRDFQVLARLRGQYANQNLLPSEQFGVGGFDTVRGYEQREANGDNGVIANLELRTPTFGLSRFFKRCWCDQLTFLTFADFGWAYDHRAIEGEKRSATLYSVGIGLRYFYDPYLSVRIDWGFPLKKSGIVKHTHSRVDVSVTASF